MDWVCLFAKDKDASLGAAGSAASWKGPGRHGALCWVKGMGNPRLTSSPQEKTLRFSPEKLLFWLSLPQAASFSEIKKEGGRAGGEEGGIYRERARARPQPPPAGSAHQPWAPPGQPEDLSAQVPREDAFTGRAHSRTEPLPPQGTGPVEKAPLSSDAGLPSCNSFPRTPPQFERSAP